MVVEASGEIAWLTTGEEARVSRAAASCICEVVVTGARAASAAAVASPLCNGTQTGHDRKDSPNTRMTSSCSTVTQETRAPFAPGIC